MRITDKFELCLLGHGFIEITQNVHAWYSLVFIWFIELCGLKSNVFAHMYLKNSKTLREEPENLRQCIKLCFTPEFNNSASKYLSAKICLTPPVKRTNSHSIV